MMPKIARRSFTVLTVGGFDWQLGSYFGGSKREAKSPQLRDEF
jgi:hypothetical protein